MPDSIGFGIRHIPNVKYLLYYVLTPGFQTDVLYTLKLTYLLLFRALTFPQLFTVLSLVHYCPFPNSNYTVTTHQNGTLEWWKQDRNVKTKTKTKTKIVRPRPRPVATAIMHNRRKTLLLQHACLLSKNNLAQKTSKKWWPVTFGTVAVLITRRNRGACYISALSCHTASCRAQQCWKQDQKYKTKNKTNTKIIRPRPRPRSVWDRSCHKTVVSDPKTGTFRLYKCLVICSFSVTDAFLL